MMKTARASDTMDLDVTGMSCAACVRRIETAVKQVSGVTDARVNLANRRATVTYDPQRVGVDQVTAAIHHAGYEAAPTIAAGHGGHGSHLQHDQAVPNLRRQVVITVAATVPVVAIAMAHGYLGSGWVGALVQADLATIVLAGPGRHILRPAFIALRHRTADMNTLVSLGVLAAWGYSMTMLIIAAIRSDPVNHQPLYFEAAAVILCFVLLGKLLEARSRRRLADAVAGLVALRPADARRLIDGRDELVPVEAVRVGDRLLVRPGERFPADGSVEQGTSTADAALITGESMPADIGVGSQVREGTLNLTGAIDLVVTAIGSDSALGRIIRAVEQAQGSRAPIARLADQVSAIFVPIVLGIALVTATVWLLVDHSSSGIGVAVEHAIAVLVIACPCALGLATPAAVAVGTGRGAELGVLFKGGAAVETASRVTTVLLDKTGTLTTGHPVVSEILAFAGHDERSVLTAAASAERGSEHPLAQAIVSAARERGQQLVMPQGVVAVPGKGVRATVEGRHIVAGTARWFTEEGLASPEGNTAADRLARSGRTPVLIAIDRSVAGAVGLLDQPTPAARETVSRLHGLGIAVAMVTGDRAEAAQAIATDLGITEVHAEVRPEEKAQLVAQAQARGQVVAMVGDGLNDAPALAGANLGIAIGGGTDVAQAAADVVLVHGIAGLPVALDLAQRTLRTIRQNLFWAFAYNVVGIPVAAGVLVPLTGWSLSPMLASVAMALSSVSVLTNSLRLRRVLART